MTTEGYSYCPDCGGINPLDNGHFAQAWCDKCLKTYSFVDGMPATEEQFIESLIQKKRRENGHSN